MQIAAGGGDVDRLADQVLVVRRLAQFSHSIVHKAFAVVVGL